jgi:TetR/AcrR family transcriptional regulator of autoinduction and epiphytic fitness
MQKKADVRLVIDKETAGNLIDGRQARALKTRNAISDALLDLIREGDLSPTARQIAVRAGVSERSIFQHFSDLEELLKSATERQIQRIAAMSEVIPTNLTFSERLKRFVMQRSRILEDLMPIRRAAILQEPFSREIKRGRDKLSLASLEEIKTVFSPELSKMPRDRRQQAISAIDMAVSWNAWEHLRFQGYSVESAQNIVSDVIQAVVRFYT